MDPIVGAIVTPVVESLMVPVKKHLRYLISCRKYVKDMHTKMEKLKTTRLGVECDVNYNKSNSLEVPREIEAWLTEVGMIHVQVKTIHIDVGSCFNFKVRHKLGRDAFKIIQDIDHLMEEKASFNWTNNPITLAEVVSSKASNFSPLSDYTDFKSREPTYMKAFNALKADKPHMIALCGMGGVGKTKMTEKLQKVVREDKMFDFVIEVAIGEKMDVSIIQKAIAEQLAVDLKESTKEARVSKLRNGFEEKSDNGKKKFLLILDDVWERIDLRDIGLSTKPDQGVDFKVLLTSRDRNVCIQMGVELDSILNLEVIEDSEAQDFFLQFVKISDDVDLHKIGDDIAIRCHGLPIAIETIALTLQGKSKHEWEDTLSKLEHKDVHSVVGEIFAISYKNIHDEETRLTLLLCGLFPEDFNTPTEDLVRYGYGLKLFKNVDTIREVRNRLNTCIDRLIHTNLLIRSEEVGCVKMHDLVRAFILNVCSEGEHCSIVGKWSAKPINESCKMISSTCAGMHEFPRNQKYPNLLLLKLMHGDELLRFPEDFYEEKRKLEVVAFDEMKYPLHLRSLQCSINLRTLCLHKCSLMLDCSSIGNLLNLEVLSFAYSSIHKLPSTIINLKELKLLDLTGCRYLCIDDGILKFLNKLEELYMKGARRMVNADHDEFVECLANLDALEIEFFDDDALPHNMSFNNLKRFKISLGCHLDETDGQSRYSFENTLALVTDECELLECGMKELFEKTKVLYLHVDGLNDLADGLGASLHNLRVLDICKCTNLRYLFTIHVANGLKQLERLEVSSCHVLETLVDSPEICEVEVIKFPALKFLSLKELPMLTSLCKDGNVIELPQLEELKLRSLPNLTSIYQHFLKKEVMNSKLKKLMIWDMPKLTEIWPSQLSDSDRVISQLREIKVERCDSLVNLFPSNPMSLVRHLERLSIWACRSIDVIFNIDLGSSCVGEVEENIKNLRSIKVWKLGELREVWRVKGVNNSNNDLPILGFQNVECIEILECERLRNVFTPTTLNFDMKALTKISINGTYDGKENKSDNSQINQTRNSFLTPCSIGQPYEMIENMSQVEEINVVPFPAYLIHTCSYLHTLDIRHFKRVEVVFEIENPNSRKSTTTVDNQQPPLLPCLKDLILEGMQKMTHVWKYDRIQFLIFQQDPTSSSFPNLTSIRLNRCNRIKHLFSPIMAKLLSNLNSLTIYNCNAIEEIVSNIDNEYEEIATSIPSNTNTTFFPHLEILNLSGLKSLKHIDGVGATAVRDQLQSSKLGVTYSSFCQYLRKIRIRGCDALLNLIPSHAIGQLPKLEALIISKCISMKEIFEIEGVDNNVGDVTNIDEASSDAGFAMTIPRLTNMTSLELPNLNVLHIEGCHGLQYIFTSSTLESLTKLQELKIKDCSAIQVIVKQENNGLIASKVRVVVFPRLKSLTLVGLEKLKSFFLGGNDFRWPLLDKVEMYGCPQMMIFTPGRSMAPKLKYIYTGLGKHRLECGLNFDWTTAPHENQLYDSSMWSTSDITEYLQFPWSFSNLIEVDVRFPHDLCLKKTIFPSNELVNVQNLGEAGDIKGINDETIYADDVIQIYKEKEVMSMDHPSSSSSSSLSSCVWKINPANLSNLTKVSLDGCYSLEHVFSIGMAASLIQLQDLLISDCNKLTVIVEAVQDSVNEVVSFPCLKSFQLTSLMSLKGFCLGSDYAFQWPSLDNLEIINCPKMTVFTNGQSTTPKLRVIKTSFGLCEAMEDLNSFIRTKIQEEFDI